MFFSKGGDDESSPFFDKMNEVCELQMTSQDYIPITVGENIIRSFEPDELYWVDYTKYCPTMEVRYYKNMLPEIPLYSCIHCCRFFLLVNSFCCYVIAY